MTGPATVVQSQLDAYNALDIDAFMAWWSPDAHYYAHPDKLLARGAAAIRERHVIRFTEPNLHGLLLNRIVMGQTVVDHERVTRTFPEGPGTVEVIATYEVVGALIVRAWFQSGAPTLDAAHGNP